MDFTDIAATRAGLHAFELQGIDLLPPLDPALEEFWTTVELPLTPAWPCRCKVVRPRPAPGAAPRPLVVLFFGGAFAVGTPDMVTRPARDVAARLGAVVVAPDYQRRPEHAFPAPGHSAWALLAHLARRAADPAFGADPARGFVVGGVSAGGSLAVVCGALAAAGPPRAAALGVEPLAAPLTGVFANGPLLLAPETVPGEFRAVFTSRDENAGLEGFNNPQVDEVLAFYQPDVASPWFSPLAVLDDIGTGGTVPPKFYFQVGRLDTLRDDAVVVEKLLARKGVPTRIDVLPDDGHTAWVALPVESRSTNPTIEEATMAGFEWLLS